MSALENITITIGMAITKTILKLWLKDSMIAQDVSLSIVSILSKKISKLHTRRSAERQLSELSDQISLKLLPLFKRANLREETREIIGLSVVKTIDNAKITSKLLVTQNLDPSQLEKHFQIMSPDATRDFNEVETSFYERIIHEAASYIVDISSQLPNFTERAFAEVLDITKKVLNEIEKIREISESVNPEETSARFEEEYRRAVIRNLDYLELFGIDVSVASSRYRLSIAYISLSVALTLTNENRKKIKNSQRVFQFAEQTFSKFDRLIIRGQAGSGKTTLLRWIAVHAAKQDFGKNLEKWNGKIPFFLPLRQYVESGLPAPEEFPRYVASAITGEMPNGWVHNCFRNKRAILLIDGVDEVPQYLRKQVRVWLENLIEIFEDAPIIITSRPGAIDEIGLIQARFKLTERSLEKLGSEKIPKDILTKLKHLRNYEFTDKDKILEALEPMIEEKKFQRYNSLILKHIFQEGYVDAELQPMQVREVNIFIDYWHKALAEESQVTHEKVALANLATNLKNELRKSGSLLMLATNPLMCAVLCALHRDRGQQIPSDRIELYEDCCKMLLSLRDQERGLKELYKDYPILSYGIKRFLLEDLAYWMILNGWSTVDKTRVRKRWDKKLETMPTASTDISAINVIKMLLDRSGIIREPVIGKLDFLHRSFQEYLCSKAIVENDDVGLLIKNGLDDQWWEVIILGAGQASKKVREELINGLITQGDSKNESNSSDRYKLYLLAINCVQASIELSADVIGKVKDRIAKLVPPKDRATARSLASAGESAVHHLEYKKKYDAEAIDACLHALVRIESNTVINVIDIYVKERPNEALEALFHEADSFVRDSFFKKFLVPLQLQNLHLRNVSSFKGFEHLVTLKSLHIEEFQGTELGTDLTPLGELRNLTKLELGGLWFVDNLEPLSKLSNLTTLTLGAMHNIVDLRPLLKLNSLKNFCLKNQAQKIEIPNELSNKVNIRWE